MSQALSDAHPHLVPREQAPAWLRDVPLAHRGLHDAHTPENTLAAFAAAAGAGYGVELDVMLSRDGVPVISHDASLARTTDRAEKVTALTVAELSAVRVGGTDQHVPTLAAALSVLAEVPVMVELKQPSLRAGALEEATAAVLDAHPGPWCIASFNPASVRWFRNERPDAIRVLTAGPLEGVRLPGVLKRRLAALQDLPSVQPHAVSYDLAGLPNAACATWRARGGTLVTWTAVGEEGLARARSLADNVIFEHVRP
ncbi:MAG: glycerophosphodiester phosphodiesterase family protein [Nitriliruptoraceae bacterium]